MRTSLHNPKRRKRHSLLVPLAILLAVVVAGGAVLLILRHPATGISDTPTVTEPTKPTKALPVDFINRNTASPYVMLKDITSGQVLYSKNADARCYPASLTKLVTALVSMDYVQADTVLTVGNEVTMIDKESSRAFIPVGAVMSAEQLIQAILLPSGNDAAYALAAQVGKLILSDENAAPRTAIDAFCQKMNEKAQALGCTGTHFLNPDGIHEAEHYTTAADMMKIATAALENDVIARTVATPEVNTNLLSGQGVHWINSNKLVHEGNAFTYAGATGLKTGSTDEAGYCLIASATRDGQTSIAVVMGAKEESNRWEDASGLLDISFD